MTQDASERPPARTIIVTGATGMIGRQVTAALERVSADLVRVSRTPTPSRSTSPTVQADLLDIGGRSRVCSVRADILIHLAWDVSPGFWTAESNESWLSASEDLARRFWDNGGRRVVLAGTCAEYTFDGSNTSPLNETRSPFSPSTRYGEAKLELRRRLASIADGRDDIELTSGLIFFPFGPGEIENRLVPTVIRACLAGEAPKLTSGLQVRDFMDTWAVGQAFVDLALSDVQGPVNIGSGRARTLREFVSSIRDRIDPSLGLGFGAIPDRVGDPPFLVADTARLENEVGHRRVRPESDAIDETIAYWRRAN